MTQENESRGYRWMMLGLLTVAYFLMQGSRQVFNSALPQIRESLAGSGATDTQLGLSRSVFYFAYGAMVLVPQVALCCAAMFLFGFGTGFYDCNLYAGLFDVVAPRYRAAAMSIYLSGAFFLGSPATAVLGWVGERFSLRTGFTIFAATFLLGSLAILVARFAFYGRDRITDDTKELS